MTVIPDEILIRNITFEDLDPMARYWCENTDGFWTERGVDRAKIGSKFDFIQQHTKTLKETGDLPRVAIIEYRGQAIGAHTLTELNLDQGSAVFHAHIWVPEWRKQGIGVISYVKAMDFFMRKLNLQKILFKTPLINQGALRIKTKLGLISQGPILFSSPLLIQPLEAERYEVDQELVSQLLAKLAISNR